jgi:hypothetical protein
VTTDYHFPVDIAPEGTCTRTHDELPKRARTAVLELPKSQRLQTGRHTCSLCAFQMGAMAVLDRIAEQGAPDDAAELSLHVLGVADPHLTLAP